MKRSNISKYIVLIFFLLFSVIANAQKKESVEIKTSDTLNLEKIHSPKKAAILSAIVPGLGQFYNKKYWKIPLVWGAYAGTIYAFNFNNTEYKKVKEIYKSYVDVEATDHQEIVDLYGEGRAEFFKTVKDSYRRNRDLMVLLTVGVHILNIVDANVDAHFFTFDVSPDLSLKAEPILFNKFDFSNQTTLGLRVSLKF